MRPLYAFILLLVFPSVAVFTTFFLLSVNAAGTNADHVYAPLDHRAESGDEGIIYFTVTDSISGNPVSSMWIVCTPINGPNSGNVYVWSTNSSGVAKVYCDQGVDLGYVVAEGSQFYRELPGTVSMDNPVQYVDLKILPVGRA